MVCSYFCIQDLINIKIIRRWLVDVIAVTLTLILIGVDLTILEDAWFINNIIAVLTAGALIKFIVIRKMKTSLIPLIILWAFFLCRQFAIDFRIQNY